jgi:hypothetical protein
MIFSTESQRRLIWHGMFLPLIWKVNTDMTKSRRPSRD